MSTHPWSEVDIRVIDQRIGMGVGGFDTVVRVYHKPTGLLVEVPKVSSCQYYQLLIAMEMLEAALTSPHYKG